MSAIFACYLALVAAGDPFADPGLPLQPKERFRVGRSSSRPATPMAFSHDGKRLAVVFAHSQNSDMPVHVWDVESGKRLYTLNEAKSRVMSAAFSPDGSRLATSGMDNVLRFWGAKSGKALAEVKLTGHGYALSYSADGKRLLVGSTKVELFDAATMKPVALPKLDGMEETPFYQVVALSPDGKTIAAINGNVRLWDARTGKLLRTIAREGDFGPDVVAFSGDGKGLLVSKLGRDDVARFDLATGKRSSIYVDKVNNRTTAFSLAPKAGRAARVVWETYTESAVVTIDAKGDEVGRVAPGPVRSVLLSPDGKRVALARPDGALQVYDAEKGKLHKTFLAAWPTIFRTCYADGGKVLRVVHDDGTVNDFSADDGKHLATRRLVFGKDEVPAAVANGGGMLLSRGPDAVRVWSLKTGKASASVPLKGATQATFSANGEHLAALTGGPDRATAWEAHVATTDGKVVKTVGDKSGTPSSVATDGASLYVGFSASHWGPNGPVFDNVLACRYDLKSGKEVSQWRATKPKDVENVTTSGAAIRAIVLAPKSQAVAFVEEVTRRRVSRREDTTYHEHWLRTFDPSEPAKERRDPIAGWRRANADRPGPSEQWQHFGHYALSEPTALSPKGRSLTLLSVGYSEKADKLAYHKWTPPVWRTTAADAAGGRWTLTDGSVEVRPGGAEVAIGDQYGSVVVVRVADLKEVAR